MRKVYVVMAMAFLASCGHNPVADNVHPAFDRMPSSTSEMMSCGLLSSTETARNAVDVNLSEKIDDRLYTLQVDCNKDQVVDAAKEQRVVGVPANQVKPSQKGWITRWRKIAVNVQKDQSAKPYVCMKYQAAYDPCTANKNVYGTAPRFSSKINFGKKVN